MYRQPHRTRAALALIAAGLALAGTSAAQEGADFRDWTDEQKEEFLRTAEVIDVDDLEIGITQPLRATLRLGDLVHEAHIQRVDERAPIKQLPTGTEFNYRDYWGFNIAAYRLDRLLGLNIVPAAVERKYRGSAAAFSWWIEDIQMMEKERWQKGVEPPNRDAWNEQMRQVRVFNTLAYNTDPNLGNVLIDDDWKIWLVDYTRAFRFQTDLLNAKSLTHIDRGLLERLRTLSSEMVTNALGDSLNKREQRALLERRDKIVQLFDDKIASEGADAVLYGAL